MMQNRKRSPRHDHGAPTAAAYEEEEGVKGHRGGPRRSLWRDVFLVMIAFSAPLAIMHSMKPKETNRILESISEEVLEKIDEVGLEAQKELSQAMGMDLDAIRSSRAAADEEQGEDEKANKTIAYVVPFFWECNQESKAFYRDAGIILRQSIHQQSSRNPNSGSEFDYQLYALTLKGQNCPNYELQSLGYKVIPVETPVKLETIRSEYVKEHMAKMDEGGHHQFIQLLAHEVVEEPIFVVMFVNSLLLQPLDDLFHAIQHDKSTPQGRAARAHIQSKLERPKDVLPPQINTFFVRDYPNTGYNRKPVVYSQGFLVARKDPTVLQQAVDLIHQANHVPGNELDSGWGGKGYSMYFKGGMVMPGFFAWFLDEFRADTSVELSGCRFNHNGMDNHYRKSPRYHPSFKAHVGKCRSGERECGDCTTTDVESIYTILYDDTCHRPWSCCGEGEPGGSHNEKIDTQTTTVEHCLILQQQWHSLRRGIENTLASEGADTSTLRGATGHYTPYSFQGHCMAPSQYLTMTMSRQTEDRIGVLLWGEEK